MAEKFYIFTECFDCAPILKNCLISFFKFHPNVIIHVFGKAKDFNELGEFENAEYINLEDDKELEECFKHGHMGTAHVFTMVIKKFADCSNVIHFDSDTIFRGEIISVIQNAMEAGYDLVGPRRCYKNNANGRTDLGDLKDVVQTYLFGFNKHKIHDKLYDFATLRNMIVGFHNPLNHPILDFFDPVSFDILHNNGKVFFLNPDDTGGLLEDGSKLNKYPEQNKDMDFGDKIMHFAGVGSGMKIYTEGPGQMNPSYMKWALNRYAVYYLLFEKKELLGLKYTEDMKHLVKLITPFIHEANPEE